MTLSPVSGSSTASNCESSAHPLYSAASHLGEGPHERFERFHTDPHPSAWRIDHRLDLLLLFPIMKHHQAARIVEGRVLRELEFGGSRPSGEYEEGDA